MLHMWSILLSLKSVPHIIEHIVEHIMFHCAHDVHFPAKKQKKKKIGKFLLVCVWSLEQQDVHPWVLKLL